MDSVLSWRDRLATRARNILHAAVYAGELPRGLLRANASIAAHKRLITTTGITGAPWKSRRFVAGAISVGGLVCHCLLMETGTKLS